MEGLSTELESKKNINPHSQKAALGVGKRK